MVHLFRSKHTRDMPESEETMPSEENVQTGEAINSGETIPDAGPQSSRTKMGVFL
jgi:hypothetical protein